MQAPPPLTVVPGRPKVLTAAAILCLIFGAMGLFGLLGAMMALSGAQVAPMPGGGDAAKELMNEPHVKALSVYGGLIGAAVGAAAVAAGIGLMKCRDWARKVAIFWSFYHILAAIGGAYITSKYMMPLMQKMMEAQIKLQSNGKESDAAAAFGSKVGTLVGTLSAIFGVLFAVAVAVTVIILVTRPQGRAACRPASLGGSGPAPS